MIPGRLDPRKTACAKEDPDLFFGPDSEPERIKNRREARAKQVCMGCEVRQACLEQNLDRPFGVWGGMGEDERRKLNARQVVGR